MAKEKISIDDQKSKTQKPQPKERDKDAANPGAEAPGLQALQQTIGNQAVQRLIQRSAEDESAYELDDQTSSRIQQAQGGGQALDAGVQEQMGTAMGQDFSDVRVHNSNESSDLNRQVDAKAFTTGSDIFFGDGEYDPHSSGGQELLAHELTHVVQQGSGATGGGGGGMTVNAPDDAFEKEADSVAQSVASSEPAPNTVHRQEELPEEEMQTKRLQRQEEEEMQMKRVQRQEEEELAMTKRIQRQPMEEEEEMLQPKLQRQEEEELAMPKRIQRQDEEELAMKQIQRQPMEEEEEMLQPKLQRQEEEEEELMPKRNDVQRQEELPEEEL